MLLILGIAARKGVCFMLLILALELILGLLVGSICMLPVPVLKDLGGIKIEIRISS